VALASLEPAVRPQPADRDERITVDPGSARLHLAWTPIGIRPLRARRPALIETERLRMRQPVTADFPAFAAMARDPSMFTYSERSGAITREEAWALLLRHIGYWTTRGYGVFALEEKTTGRFVGQVGPSDFRRDLGADFDPWPELTWSVAAPARGRGYATEAAAAALDWLRGQAAPARSVCLIHEANAPSLRVADKLGYRELRRRRYRGYPAILFEREEPS
jgi:RimJ/RimL family protein N-acetyltransferase